MAAWTAASLQARGEAADTLGWMPRTPRYLLVAAAACATGCAGVMALAYYVPSIRHADASALAQFVTAGWPNVWSTANAVMFLCDPGPFALLAGLLLVAVAAKRGPRRAAALLVLLAGANASSEILKPLLAHHRSLAPWPHIHQVPAASFPSGHSAAAMSLALALVLGVPHRHRVLAAIVGGLFSLAVSFAVLILDAHFPSDVVGGHLLAAAWALTALAALRHADFRWPEVGTVRRAARAALERPRVRLAGYLALLLLATAALAVTRSERLSTFLEAHTALVVVAAAVTVSTGVLLAGVTALSSRRG